MHRKKRDAKEHLLQPAAESEDQTDGVSVLIKMLSGKFTDELVTTWSEWSP